MPSFDIVSKIDMQEVDNAVIQAKKELQGRWDFRGVTVDIGYTDDKKSLFMKTDDEERLEQVWDVLLGKLIKRGITPNSLERGSKDAVGGKLVKQEVKLQQGIPTEKAKELVKRIKDSKIKAQASIQGDAVRVTSKDRDDLQAVIALCRTLSDELKLDMQYTNRRD